MLLGAVMLLEAAVLFAGFKMLGGGGPSTAAGAELSTSEGNDHGDGHGGGKAGKSADKKKPIELLVLDFKAPNKASGRTFLYDVAIYVVTKADHEKQVKDTLKEREALIKDRIRTIIAQSDPEKLTGGSEPGLETLRRQVKYQLDMILGEGVIERSAGAQVHSVPRGFLAGPRCKQLANDLSARRVGSPRMVPNGRRATAERLTRSRPHARPPRRAAGAADRRILIDQASIDELLKQASFEDPSAFATASAGSETQRSMRERR